MNSFSYDSSKSRQRFIKSRLIFILALTAPFVIDQFYDIEFIKPGNIYLILGYLTVAIIRDLNEPRVYKIDFDDQNKKIRFFRKTQFGKSRKLELPFSGIQLNVSSRKRRGKRKIYLIDFENNKQNIASICNERHRFDAEDLYYIYKAAGSFKIETKVA